ncbi:MAG: 3-deoxy-manno-octulosonate cytidylyltransferase [Candidatus Tenebribacter davisii]|nr:3-deoxy-manno-octulosonate cytidylyltransferase [Candidatus Tenebribacter davisii]
MKAIAVIPARFDSTRFPGKPLAKLGNKYIIQRVYEQTKSSGLFAEVIVGTEDQRIFEAVAEFGGKVTLTSKKHRSGTDRVAEVCKKLPCCSDAEVIVNVQGDEPFITEEPLNELIKVFTDPSVQVASLMHKITQDITDPNTVKVVCDKNNNALYFSRLPIPYPRSSETDYFKHVGVYAFRRKILLEFVELPVSKLERIEKLEQLRFLENGYQIRMVLTDYKGIGIDTPQDLKKAENLLRTIK